VGNYPELDVSRFQLYARALDPAVDARWLCYFTWSSAQRDAALVQARRGPSIIVSYRRNRPLRAFLEFLNRHSEDCLRAALDSASGFHRIGDLGPKRGRYTLELYANFETDG